MAYGTVKVDNITFTNGGIDQTVTVSGIVQSISGNITATGTIQGATIIGTSTVSGATVTGNAGVFTTVTGGSAGFTTVTGTTVTGTTANFATISGTTITGSVGNFGSGSAAAPSVSVGTTDNGIYSPGTDQVAISTNGTGRLFVDASGRVGVGFASVESALHAGGNSNSPVILAGADSAGSDVKYTFRQSRGTITSPSDTGGEGIKLSFEKRASSSWASPIAEIYAAGDGSGATGYLEFLTKPSGGSATPRLRITSAGLVGIGTSSPGSILHLQQSASAAVGPDLRLANNAGTASDKARISFYGGTSPTVRAAYDFNINASGAGEFIWSNGEGSLTERMRLDASGRLGIGTTSPGATLHVATSGNPEVLIGGTQTPILSFVGGAGSEPVIGYGVGSLRIGTVTGAGAAGFSEKARFDTSGRLLVGTSSASYSTTVKLQGNSGSSTGESRIRLCRGTASPANGDTLAILGFSDNTETPSAEIAAQRDGGTWSASSVPGRLVFSTTADGASSPTERWRYTNNGETQIRNMAEVFPVTDNTCLLGKSGNRWSAVWAANGTIQTSDARAKSEIADASLGADFIKSLRPVSYKWVEGGKRDTGERDEDNNYIYEAVPGERTHWGFIAQEVKEAVDAAGVDFGGWVLTDKDDPDSQQALRYDQFIAPLTKALQEALAEIDVLKAKVAALEAN